MSHYRCPHCGAEDSTRCEKLPVLDGERRRAYSWRELDRARKVGCRVVHYIDLKTKS